MTFGRRGHKLNWTETDLIGFPPEMSRWFRRTFLNQTASIWKTSRQGYGDRGPVWKTTVPVALLTSSSQAEDGSGVQHRPLLFNHRSEHYQPSDVEFHLVVVDLTGISNTIFSF